MGQEGEGGGVWLRGVLSLMSEVPAAHSGGKQGLSVCLVYVLSVCVYVFLLHFLLVCVRVHGAVGCRSSDLRPLSLPAWRSQLIGLQSSLFWKIKPV